MRIPLGFLLLLAQPTTAWRTLGFNTTNVSYQPARWAAQPAIRWAFSPDFCDEMRPLLWEKQDIGSAFGFDFSACDRLHAAVQQAFSVWQANTVAVHFVEVTGRCTAEGLWRPIPATECIRSPLCKKLDDVIDWTIEDGPIDATDKCSHATCFECERADVVVGAFAPHNRDLGDAHVFSRITSRSLSQERPIGTNGLPQEGLSIGSGLFLQFNVDTNYRDGVDLPAMCWRLDADLCEWFARQDRGDTLTIATALFSLAFAACLCTCLVACLWGLQRLASNLLQGWDLDDDGKVELQEMVYVLDEFCGELCFECRCPNIHSQKMSVLSGCLGVLETITHVNIAAVCVIVAFIIALPIAFFQFVQPCWDCHDFRAAAVHEVGHLLSLDHSLGARASSLHYHINSTRDCHWPSKSLITSDQTKPLGSPVMQEFGTDSGESPGPLRCLDRDDLDGLNFLYPTCSDVSRTPSCPSRIGGRASGLRYLQTFFVVYLIPLLFFSGLKLLAVTVVWCQEQRAQRQLAGQVTRFLRRKSSSKSVDVSSAAVSSTIE